MRRRSVVPFIVVLVLSCTETPTDIPLHDGERAQAAVAGAAGAQRFAFLPPLAPQQALPGVGDGTLSPVVSVCEWDGTACVGADVVTFTKAANPNDGIRAGDDGSYHVNWNTQPYGVSAGTRYRIAVSVADALLGAATVLVVQAQGGPGGGSGASEPTVVRNQTLAIRFRIMQGAVPPHAEFTVGGSQQAGSPTTFDASASFDRTGAELTYAWDFGNGNRGGGRTIATTYTAAGTYTVSLVVTNPLGASDASTQTLTIAPPPPPSNFASVSGMVTSAAGQPLAGVKVERVDGGGSANTNAQGKVTLHGVPAGATAALRLTLTDHTDQVVLLDIPAGVTSAYFTAALVPRAAPVTIASLESGGTATGTAGASVTLPAGSLVDGAGNPVTGSVDVRMTPLAVGSGSVGLPGSSTGVRADGTEGTLLTYGAAEYVLTSNGQKLQLGMGSTATIRIPLHAAGVSAGQQLALWSLDEAAGKWVAEGVGTVVATGAGFALEAEVSHFSWWSANVFIEAPFAPHVQCLDPLTFAGMPCLVVGKSQDPAGPTTTAYQHLPAEGATLLLPPDLSIKLVGVSADGRFRGEQIVSGAGGTGGSAVIPLHDMAASPVTAEVWIEDDEIMHNRTTTAWLQARNSAGEPLTVGGDIVSFGFEIIGEDFPGAFGVLGMTDHGNGLYSAVLRGSRVGAPVRVGVTINAQRVQTPLPTLHVTLGLAHPATSTVTIAQSGIAVGQSTTVTVQARDAAGNLVTEGGDAVGFSLGAGAFLSRAAFSMVTDHGDGTYTATVTGTQWGQVVAVLGFVSGIEIQTPLPAVQVTPVPLTAQQVHDLSGVLFNRWWVNSHGLIAWPLTVMADQATSSWGNEGMQDLSSEPRQAWNNSPHYGSQFTTLRAWSNLYFTLSGVWDVLHALDAGVALAPADAARNRALAKLVQGLSHGYLALIFDKAFVLDESVDMMGSVPLQSYGAVMTEAIAQLEAAIAIAETNSFTLPAGWTNSTVPVTNQRLAQLAHSYIAKFLAQVARHPGERLATDWGRVVQHLDAGLEDDFVIQGNNGVWFDRYKFNGNDPLWFRGDYRTIGGVRPNDPETDPAGSFAAWLATPVHDRQPFDLATADRRLWNGQLDGLNRPLGGKDFDYRHDNQFLEQRGTYHFSHYAHSRYAAIRNFDGVGPAPLLLAAELDLLRAEALIRTGQGGAAGLVNRTRVGRGELSAANDGDADLFDKLAYEKRIETFFAGAGVAWFDRRGWDSPHGPNDFGHGLLEGTPAHFPIPGWELVRFGIPPYTFGGAGPAFNTADDAVGFAVPARMLYGADPDATPAQRLRTLLAEPAAARLTPAAAAPRGVRPY